MTEPGIQKEALYIQHSRSIIFYSEQRFICKVFFEAYQTVKYYTVSKQLEVKYQQVKLAGVYIGLEVDRSKCAFYHYGCIQIFLKGWDVSNDLRVNKLSELNLSCTVNYIHNHFCDLQWTVH